MWMGYTPLKNEGLRDVRKGDKRTADGRFATTAEDSGIGHKGDGFLDLADLLKDPDDLNLRSGAIPSTNMAGTAFDGLDLSPAAGAH